MLGQQVLKRRNRHAGLHRNSHIAVRVVDKLIDGRRLTNLAFTFAIAREHPAAANAQRQPIVLTTPDDLPDTLIQRLAFDARFSELAISN